MDNYAALDRYASLFENISPAILDNLDDYFTADARFKDPFNDVRGLDRLHHVFTRMFDTCRDISFRVHERFLDGDIACLTWTMRFRPDVIGQRNTTWEIHGASRIRFNAAGLVEEHIDYWDSGEYFYAKLPLIGALVRMIRQRAG